MRSLILVLSMAGMAALLVLSVQPAAARVPVSLRGSPASMERQHHIAQSGGLTFVKHPDDVFQLAEAGDLVALIGNRHLNVLPTVSFPYAQPEVRLFIERLAEQYHTATGEKLVVTSLTRPSSDQPWNSHPLSVHPAGMAIDLRISDREASRQWLESVLLSLEKKGLLDVTRERRPPHYHVALFPDAYRGHVERLIGPKAVATALLWMAPREEKAGSAREAISVKHPAALAPLMVEAQQDGDESLAVVPLLILALGLLYVRRVKRRSRTATV